MFELKTRWGTIATSFCGETGLEGCRGCTEQHRGNRRQIFAADFHPRAFGTAGRRKPEDLGWTSLGRGRECCKQQEAAAGRLHDGDPGDALWWKQFLSSTSGSRYVKVTRRDVMSVTVCLVVHPSTFSGGQTPAGQPPGRRRYKLRAVWRRPYSGCSGLNRTS